MSLEDHSISIPHELHSQIAELAQQAGKSEEEIVRDAIDAYREARAPRSSAYDLAKKAGWFEGGTSTALPADLATNKAYMEGFGGG